MTVKENTVHPRGVDSVKMTSVVELRLTVGAGVEGDPVRTVMELWSLDGKRLAVVDPYLTGGIERASSSASSASI